MNLEREKLKEKVAKLITEKSGKGASSIQLANPLISTDFIEKEKKNDEMYNIVISNYEEHEKEIMMENSGLRSLLQDFYRLIVQKMNIEQKMVFLNHALD